MDTAAQVIQLDPLQVIWAFVALLTGAIAYAEIRIRAARTLYREDVRALEQRNAELRRRVDLLENNICTSDQVRTIVAQECQHVTDAQKRTEDKIDDMLQTLHSFLVEMAANGS